MSPGGWRYLVALAVVAITACGGNAGEEAGQARPDSTARADSLDALRKARADSVAKAESLYSPAGFDSIAWRNDTERYERGKDVWRFSCSDCHGQDGRGDGPVAERYGYRVPDFHAADWKYAGDLAALRHRVFVGHESAMPTWGLYGLTYRDIDAVTYYVDQTFGKR